MIRRTFFTYSKPERTGVRFPSGGCRKNSVHSHSTPTLLQVPSDLLHELIVKVGVDKEGGKKKKANKQEPPVSFVGEVRIDGRGRYYGK